MVGSTRRGAAGRRIPQYLNDLERAYSVPPLRYDVLVDLHLLECEHVEVDELVEEEVRVLVLLDVEQTTEEVEGGARRDVRVCNVADRVYESTVGVAAALPLQQQLDELG